MGDIQVRKQELGRLLKIDELKKQAADIQAQMSEPGFWKDQKKASQVSQKLAQIQKIIQDFELVQTPEELEELELLALLTGEYDAQGALVTIHAGAGGTEAQDWAEMLLRMYCRYGQLQEYQVKILDQSPGQEAGIKSATLLIEGPYAFGFLKAEAGVHRLVRLSPFDADKARHTSFALVEVIPEMAEDQIGEIPEKDLRIDVFRSSGHGGQSVNTTDSAVRITHLPTKLTVSCQNERSQLQNRTNALKILLSRLNQLKLIEHKEKLADLQGEIQSPEWGSQIRSYVLHPYKLVKDHRTGFKSQDPNRVLNGDIQGFIGQYLKYTKTK